MFEEVIRMFRLVGDESWQILACRHPCARRCFSPFVRILKGTREGMEQTEVKECSKALTLTKKGTISMTMASFKSGFSMGFNRATCKEKQT